MIVMKFGGSSLANAERFRSVAGIVSAALDRKPVLVLSALGDTTDILMDAAEEAVNRGPLTVVRSVEKITEIHRNVIIDLGLSKSVPDNIGGLLADMGALLAGVALISEFSPRSRDTLLSFGERLSVRVAEMYFKSLGFKAQAVDAWDAGIMSEGGSAVNHEILEESWENVPKKLLPMLESGILPIVTGFISKDKSGFITTLGRGGSDLTASFIAAACRAEEAQVWKDVDGIMTSDPRVIKNALPVAEATYEEAAELAYFGAQVLHPRAMLPCSRAGIPVFVKNSYNTKAQGTRICAEAAFGGRPVRALTSRTGVTLIDIVSVYMLGQSGFLGEVFQSFARHQISVDMVATSEVSVSLTLDSVQDIKEIETELSRIARFEAKTNRAIVSIICDVKESSIILRRAFAVCAELGIQVQMISQGASKVNISFVVQDSEEKKLLAAFHKEFFEQPASMRDSGV